MSIFEEEVGGIIIGGDLRRYEFWTETKPALAIASSYFFNDDAAIEWFKLNYQESFARGAEMRVFD